MKKITFLTLIGFIFFLATTKAQSPIAVQNESGSSFYSMLDEAITNAIAGDYIYIPSGVFTISVPIDKQLQIFGVGHNPDSCAVTGITMVTGNILIINGSDHGLITGIKISGNISFGAQPNDVSINYFAIERCNIGGTINLASRSSNILINECILRGPLIGNNTQGFQMSKCIIEPLPSGINLYSFDSNAYFNNNIFLPSNGVNQDIRFASINNCYIKNNVFLSRVYDGANTCINNLFQNNLFLGPINIPVGTNLYRGNINGGVTILFVNRSGFVFDYKHDYHIKTDSPAHNAGTDGTDLGIYGTGNPWKEGSLPTNPHIQSKSISTVDGNLNVKIKVAAQNN